MENPITVGIFAFLFDYSSQCYLKLVVLLYADDMVLLDGSMEELQHLLDKFQIYCSQWKLKVNPEKSKVVFLVISPYTEALLVSMHNH